MRPHEQEEDAFCEGDIRPEKVMLIDTKGQGPQWQESGECDDAEIEKMAYSYASRVVERGRREKKGSGKKGVFCVRGRGSESYNDGSSSEEEGRKKKKALTRSDENMEEKLEQLAT